MLILSKEVAAKWFFTLDYCNEKTIKDTGDASNFIECSSIGITHEDYPTYVSRLFIPKQTCTSVTTELDRKSLDIQRMDLMFDEKINSSRTQIWFHTHPSDCSNPSGTDEETWKTQYMEPEHAFAAMGIISKNYSNTSVYCKVGYNSPIGQKDEKTPIYIYINEKYSVPLSYVYELAAVNKKFNMPNIHNGFFKEFKNYHSEWLDDIKNNVEIAKPKQSRNVTTGTFVRNTNGVGYTVVNNKKKEETAASAKQKITDKTTSLKDGTIKKEAPSFDVDILLSTLIDAQKNSFNGFHRSNQKALLKKFNTNQHEIQLAQKHIKRNEESVHMIDLEFMSTDEDNPFDILCSETGESNFNNLDPVTLKKLCLDYTIRPSKVMEMFNDYVEYAKEQVSNGHQ